MGLAAGEAEQPERSLPRAVNGVIARILIFYIGSLTVVMALIPWRQIVPTESPFVLVFARIGLPATAAVINLVLISAVLSSCNSGLFAAARTLQVAGGQRSCAPLAFPAGSPRRSGAWHHRLGGGDVRWRGAELFRAGQSAGIHHHIVGRAADGHLDQHHRQPYRLSRPAREVRSIAFPMPLYPWASWIVLAFIAGVALIMATMLQMYLSDRRLSPPFTSS